MSPEYEGWGIPRGKNNAFEHLEISGGFLDPWCSFYRPKGILFCHLRILWIILYFCSVRGNFWSIFSSTDPAVRGTIWFCGWDFAGLWRVLSSVSNVCLALGISKCNGDLFSWPQGDVYKTRGGGQSVQFTDIETLKQESPTGWVIVKGCRVLSLLLLEEHTNLWTGSFVTWRSRVVISPFLTMFLFLDTK